MTCVTGTCLVPADAVLPFLFGATASAGTKKGGRRSAVFIRRYSERRYQERRTPISGKTICQNIILYHLLQLIS